MREFAYEVAPEKFAAAATGRPIEDRSGSAHFNDVLGAEDMAPFQGGFIGPMAALCFTLATPRLEESMGSRTSPPNGPGCADMSCRP